jgi:hypothetical protein
LGGNADLMSPFPPYLMESDTLLLKKTLTLLHLPYRENSKKRSYIEVNLKGTQHEIIRRYKDQIMYIFLK